jgi:signal transduction histidine kinase
MQNLFANALKFAKPGVPASIHVRAAKEGGDWVIRVEDNGCGFDREHAQAVFEPFRRLDSSTQGTGLGLTICKKIVERHGGRMWAESEPGVGSRFYFSLPAKKASSASHK